MTSALLRSLVKGPPRLHTSLCGSRRGTGMVMELLAKGIGHQLRKMFTGVIRRPMGWRIIDALGRLEDKEEALRNGEEIVLTGPSHRRG